MEGANVEPGPELCLGACAQVKKLKLTRLVGQRLAWECNVTIHLCLHAALVYGGVLVEVIDHLLSRPALAMHTGVHHQADCSPDIGLQPSVVVVRIGVEADILAQVLRVQAPALDERRVTTLFAELGNPLQFLRDGDLQVVAGTPS